MLHSHPHRTPQPQPDSRCALMPLRRRRLRVARLRVLLKRYEDIIDGLEIIAKLTALLLVMLVLSHFLCCMWYAIGATECGWVEYQVSHGLQLRSLWIIPTAAVG